MNWKVLDIRCGRANRLQFITIAAILCMLLPPSLMIKSFPIPLLIILYMYCLFSARRMRDTGYSAWWATPPVLAFIILGITFNLAIRFPEAIVIFVTFSFFASFLAVMFILVTLVFLVFVPGSIGPNKYGAAPEKLNFLSMVTSNKQEKQSEFHKKMAEQRHNLEQEGDVQT